MNNLSAKKKKMGSEIKSSRRPNEADPYIIAKVPQNMENSSRSSAYKQKHSIEDEAPKFYFKITVIEKVMQMKK